MYRVTLLAAVILISSCAVFEGKDHNLYAEIGGKPVIARVADGFIEQIGFDHTIYPYFAESNIDRFREKFIEHLCVTLDGPCTYTGDSMALVHRGMNINEADFNRTVELLIAAMSQAEISHRHQNLILQRLAPMREEMLYR